MCTEPLTIWLHNAKPIDFPQWDEERQHRHNRAQFREHAGLYAIQVPCGRCLECRLQKANMWACRCALEAKQWRNCCFVTLTYNNQHLPFSKNGQMTLRKKDVQDFWKRLRWHEKGMESWENPKTGKIENPIRYFVCGEYGPTNGRPHYHAIIFNWKPNDLKPLKVKGKRGHTLYKSKKLKKLWGNGFCVVGEGNYETACYTARYCQKKAGAPVKKRKFTWWQDVFNKWHKKMEPKNPNEPEDEFLQMSTGVGIGYTWWLENKERCKETFNIIVKGKTCPIPRYFKKKWNEEDWEDFENYKYQNILWCQKKRAEKIEHMGITDKADPDNYLNKQRAETLIFKARALKRDNFVGNANYFENYA